MNSWFRLYHEILDDPKIQKLSGETFKQWINILCLASRHEGSLPECNDIAFALRLSVQQTQTVLDELYQNGLIDKRGNRLYPHNWDARQYKSDTSTARVKRFRKRKRNVSVTADVTPPDQNRADTEQNRTEEIHGASAPHLQFGEFGWVHVTSEQYAKLKKSLNGSLESYIARFDRWVNEAPDAKAHGVRRRDRHAYESMMSWFDRDSKEGTTNGHKTKTDRNAEAARRLLSRLDSENRSGGGGGNLGSDPGGLLGAPTSIKPD